MSTRLSLALCLPLLLLNPAAADAQACVAADKLSMREVQAIQTLARRMGMQGPLRLCADYWWLPSACEAVRVDSLPKVEGLRRAWQQLYLKPQTERRLMCRDAEHATRLQALGGWATSREHLTQIVAWRFSDGPHHADVRLGNGISVPLAERIIRALLDQRWVGELDAEGRDLLARWHREAGRLTEITSIYPYGDHGYEVRMGETGGLLVQVEVTEAVVTVIRVSFYLV